MNFHHYHELRAAATELPELQPLDLQQISFYAKFLPPDHLEYLYALILHHAAFEGHYVIGDQNPPYNGKCATGVVAPTFNMSQVPSLCLKIIKVYIDRLRDMALKK